MRKHNYLIGYRGEEQCVYGNDDSGIFDWTNPLTLSQAKKLSKKTYTMEKGKKIKSTVYKLVEVKEKK